MTILERAGENRLGRAAIVDGHNRCAGAQAKVTTHCVVARDRAQHKPAPVKEQDHGEIAVDAWTIEPRGDDVRLTRDREVNDLGDCGAFDLEQRRAGRHPEIMERCHGHWTKHIARVGDHLGIAGIKRHRRYLSSW